MWELVRQGTHREFAAIPNSHPNSLARDRLPIAAALTRGPEMDPRSRSRLVERVVVGEDG